MEYRSYRGHCLCSLGGKLPPDAIPTAAPFSPLVLLVDRDAKKSRGCFAVQSIDEALEGEGVQNLFPALPQAADGTLRAFIAENGATVLNTAFSRAFDYLNTPRKTTDLRLTLVGLGDVGGTLLTALKLLGSEIRELCIYDANKALCARYEMELNQVLSLSGAPLPRVVVCKPDTLFDCDALLFTASLGVPAVGAQVKDVRMAQFTRNRQMLSSYVKMARDAHYMGLFCQISDPVDQLSRTVFLDSNKNEHGEFDAAGLLPEQIQGFGLGVMAARAAYFAQKEQIDFTNGCAFGPHGEGLVIANAPDNYDETLSRHLTENALHANLQIRELGFKPYLAPALSSAAVSILRLFRGELHYGAVPMGGTYFGCESRMTARGLCVARCVLQEQLACRVKAAHRALEEFCYD